VVIEPELASLRARGSVCGRRNNCKLWIERGCVPQQLERELIFIRSSLVKILRCHLRVAIDAVNDDNLFHSTSIVIRWRFADRPTTDKLWYGLRLMSVEGLHLHVNQMALKYWSIRLKLNRSYLFLGHTPRKLYVAQLWIRCQRSGEGRVI